MKQYEELFSTAPDSVLKYLKVAREEGEGRESSGREEEEEGKGEEVVEVQEEGRRMSRGGLVLSSRDKPLEELPTIPARAAKKVRGNVYYKIHFLTQCFFVP